MLTFFFKNWFAFLHVSVINVFKVHYSKSVCYSGKKDKNFMDFPPIFLLCRLQVTNFYIPKKCVYKTDARYIIQMKGFYLRIRYYYLFFIVYFFNKSKFSLSVVNQNIVF